MPDQPKLQVKLWGMSINAEGVVAIIATLLIILAVLAAYCF